MDETTRIRITRDEDRATTQGESWSDDPEAIRADIQRTRERMSVTVEELGDRLNPDRLRGQIKQNLHDATIGKAEHMARVAVDRVDDTRHSIMDNIRDNPIPAAMVGLGLGWLFLNSRREDHRESSRHFRYDRDFTGYGRGRAEHDLGYAPGYGRVSVGYGEQGWRERHAGDEWPHRAQDSVRTDMGQGRGQEGMTDRARDRVEDLTEEAKDRMDDLAHRAQDRVTGIAYDARDTAHDLADRAHDLIDTGSARARAMAGDVARQTRRTGHRLEDRVEHALHDSPLAVGAAAIAIGLAVGLSAPSTRREAELMGEKRDQLLDRARHGADDVKDRARHVADRMVDEVQSSAREVAEEEGLIT